MGSLHMPYVGRSLVSNVMLVGIIALQPVGWDNMEWIFCCTRGHKLRCDATVKDERQAISAAHHGLSTGKLFPVLPVSASSSDL